MNTVKPRVAYVVPCYNEEKRLHQDEFRALAKAGVALLFVDDGSTDGTRRVIEELANEENMFSLSLEKNAGKAEAVRRGLNWLIGQGSYDWVGYTDADLATPVGELLRLVSLATKTERDVVFGSRIAIAGSEIERWIIRHYIGRVFATAASLILRVAFYDTQCGAKLFRTIPEFSASLRDPFHSRWAFDVELLGRLLFGDQENAPMLESRFLEVPLKKWTDVPGSKIDTKAAMRVGTDLAKIAWALEKRKKQRRV